MKGLIMMLNDGSSQSKHKQIPMHLHEWGGTPQPTGVPWNLPTKLGRNA
jgi:hypothetical protein